MCVWDSHTLPWHFSQLEAKDIGHGHLDTPAVFKEGRVSGYSTGRQEHEERLRKKERESEKERDSDVRFKVG